MKTGAASSEKAFYEARQSAYEAARCAVKRSAVKKETHPPAAGGNFTSEAIAERLHKRNEMERLHKQGFRSLVKM